MLLFKAITYNLLLLFLFQKVPKLCNGYGIEEKHQFGQRLKFASSIFDLEY